LSAVNFYKSLAGNKRELVQGCVIFTLLFPLFFQLQGSIFTDKGMNFDSGGILTRLPLPLSSLTCFIGLAFLVRYREATRSVSFIFALFMLMLLSTFATSSQDEGDMLSKLILMVQTILPVFALALGQSYEKPDNVYLRFQAIFLYVLILVVPIEVIITLMSGKGLLSPSLYFFSIYQHLQYVPVIFVGVYFLALSGLNKKKILGWLAVFLAPFMGLYAAASLSILAISLGFFSSIVLLFLCYKSRPCSYVLASVLVFIFSLGASYSVVKSSGTFKKKFGLLAEDIGLSSSENLHALQEIKVKSNIGQRLEYWRFYLDESLQGPKEFVLGHSKRPDRNSVPSAHNYYLDLLYNFGFVVVIPFLYLIVFTLRRLYFCYKKGGIEGGFWWLASITLFFVLIDNSFKVGLRQPYPGIVMFFLWGVLLSFTSKFLLPDYKKT